MTAKLLDADGREAEVGRSRGYWLGSADFVSTEGGDLDARRLGRLGFPREWPDAYKTSAALKALIGKRGRLPGKRVAVAGAPTPEDLAQVSGITFHPLQSFANAERAAERVKGAAIIRGWAILERLDRPAGAAFVAERHWWNALPPDGHWVDLTPRPEAWQAVLLAEAAEGSPKSQSVFTALDAEIAAGLLEERFKVPRPLPSSPAAAPKAPAVAAASEKAAPKAPAVAAASEKAAPEAGKFRKVPEPQRIVSRPPAASATAAQPPKKKGLDYSKFSKIEDSDDEKIVVKEQSVTLPMGLPRSAVSRDNYDNVWQALLKHKDLPFTPAPDLDQMWGYYKHGGLDEQALLDQACEFLGKFPCRLEASDWKAKTYTLTKRLEQESREDEARMWSVICICRFPKDSDAYYNQGVLLQKMCDKVKFSSMPTARLPALGGAQKTVPAEQYCSLFARAAIGYYRRAMKVNPSSRPVYINLIGSLERNEPSGWYNDVHELAVEGVKHGIWYNMWQRPPHFVPSLVARAWHNPMDFEMCQRLEEHYPTIRAEYDAYIEKLVNRKDWDDSDTTPGLGDVGARPGALHDGGLTKSGKWREVPLFTNCTLNREYADLFPETVRILQMHCSDAVGLAFCGGGDVILSVLTPGTRLRPHCGPSNSRLTCHLGIKVPKSVEQGSWIRVAADEKRGWEEGKCIVFDDSFEHEVNCEEPSPDEPYPGDRVVLLANFWHPEFEFKNDPEWRRKSDEVMANIEVESLPQTAMMKVEQPGGKA